MKPLLSAQLQFPMHGDRIVYHPIASSGMYECLDCELSDFFMDKLMLRPCTKVRPIPHCPDHLCFAIAPEPCQACRDANAVTA